MDDKFEKQENVKLTESLRIWLNESYGTFTIDQVYRDLCVTDLKGKNLIRVNLHRAVEKGVIERGQVTGSYRKIDHEADQIEILDEIPEPLAIYFPGGIEEFVQIYPHNILINAGSTNAGKTAFNLNFAYENRDKFKVIYWSSEMGSEELTIRISKFGYPIAEWRKIKFFERTYDFHQVINPNAINIIDYLEVMEGEFFKVGDSIRKIFEKLDKGIALISLQMDTGKKCAWGGQKTMDKARLYITLDQGKMTIVKAKNQMESGGIASGLSRAFRLIDNGSRFVWAKKWVRAWET